MTDSFIVKDVEIEPQPNLQLVTAVLTFSVSNTGMDTVDQISPRTHFKTEGVLEHRPTRNLFVPEEWTELISTTSSCGLVCVFNRTGLKGLGYKDPETEMIYSSSKLLLRIIETSTSNVQATLAVNAKLFSFFQIPAGCRLLARSEGIKMSRVEILGAF